MRVADAGYWLAACATLCFCGYSLLNEGSDAGKFAMLFAIVTGGLAVYLVDWE